MEIEHRAPVARGLALALALAACSGAGSSGGGPTGPTGPSGPSGPSGTTYTLPADRITDWTHAGVTYGAGGIPGSPGVPDWAACTSLAPSGAAATDHAQLQNALDTCPENSVVNLQAGTFTLDEPVYLRRSNLILRGAGAGKTILRKTNGAFFYYPVQVVSKTSTTVTIQAGYDPNLEAGGPRAGDLLAQGDNAFGERITAVSGNTLTVARTDGLTTGRAAYVAMDAAPSDGNPLIYVAYNRYAKPDDSTSVLLTADARAGETSVTVASVAGLAPGDVVLLDETSQSSWVTDPTGAVPAGGRVPACGAWAARGSWSAGTAPQVPELIWSAVHDPAGPWDDPLAVPSAGGPTAANQYASVGDGDDSASWFSRQDRVQNELKRIQAVDAAAKRVTFDAPFHGTYRFGGPVLAGAMRVDTGHYAELVRFTTTNPAGPAVPISHVGVERLSLIGGGESDLRVEVGYAVWVKSVDASVWAGEAISFDDCLRCELRDSYVHDAAVAHPGGVGYAVNISRGSTEVLVENTISVRANKVMVARASGAGSVIAYNYMDQQLIDYDESFQEVGINGSHLLGARLMLFEGNLSSNWDSDSTHGSSSRHTVFRNWLTGFRAPFVNPRSGDTVDDRTELYDGPLRCAGTLVHTYGMNVVGNVLGVSGAMSAGGRTFLYESQANQAMLHPGIWMLGWNPGATYDSDPYSAATTIRDGNWDWLQAAQSWHGLGGAGTGAFTAPAAHVLPASLYLTAAPPFLQSIHCPSGTCPWPWVDPATGATGALPAKARYDAGAPNDDR